MSEAKNLSSRPGLTRRDLLRWSAVAVAGTAGPATTLVQVLPARAATSSFAVASDAAFFAAIDLHYPGLQSVANKLAVDDLPGAKHAYTDWVDSRSTPRFLFSPRDKTSIVNALNALDTSAKQTILATAEELYNFTFSFEGTTKSFPDGKVAWAGSGEWYNILNRFQYFQQLGFAYYLTGDAKYVARCDDLLSQWIDANPVVSTVSTSPGSWRALEVGIRVGSWLNLLGLVAGAPGFAQETEFALLRSLMEHGRFLADWMKTYQPGNWQTIGATYFGWLGVVTPDWSDGPTWRKLGLQRTEQHLVNDTNADGFQIELATSYHEDVMTLAAQSLFLDKNLNSGSGFSPQGMERLNGGFNVVYQMKAPNGIEPPLGDTVAVFDAGNTFHADEYLIPGALLFDHAYKAFGPETASANFVTSFGVAAKAQYDAIPVPEVKLESTRLPGTDLIIMRGGNAADRTPADDTSLVSLFDASIHGIGGHSHPNMLQFLAYAYGRTLLIDPGRGTSYNDPLYGSYYRTTPAHNVAQVDSQEQPAYSDKAHVGSDVFDVNPFANFARGHLLDVGGVDQSRQVVFIGDEYWIVRDRFTASPPTAGANYLASAFASSQANATLQVSNLIDGNGSTFWSSAQQATSSGNQWAAVDVGDVTEVGRMTISPRVYKGAVLCFPSSFAVQSSTDAATWTDVPGQNYTSFPSPAAGADVNLVFSSPVRARYLRIDVTTFSTDPYGKYYVQLAEIRLPDVSSPRKSHRLDQWWHFWPGTLTTDNQTVRTTYPDTANITVLASSRQPVSAVAEQGWVTDEAGTANVAAPAVRFTQTSQLPATIETIIYPDPAQVRTSVRVTDRIAANGLSERDAVGLSMSIGARRDRLYFSNVDTNITYPDGGSLNGEFLLARSESNDKRTRLMTLRGRVGSTADIGIQLPTAGLATIAQSANDEEVYDFTGALPGSIVTVRTGKKSAGESAHLVYLDE